MPEFSLFTEEEIAAHGAEAAAALAAAIEAGTPPEQAWQQIAEGNVDRFTGRLADLMEKKAPAVAERRAAGIARLAETWGRALDAYYAVTRVAADLGTLCAQRRADTASDSVTDALTLLHARACQTSFEVHALLAAGFPGGAYARFRTLHELAVTAAVIAGYGRTPEHADLAERYLDHTHIEHYRQAQARERSGPHLGWPPLDPGIMRGLKAERDRCLARYGRAYREDYGWAARLLGPKPTFARLEDKADMQVLRYLYVTASHLIHASAHGLRLTLGPGEETAPGVAAVGPSGERLAQPAMASLSALLDVTAGLVLHGRYSDELVVQLNLLALDEFRTRTLRLLDDAEARGTG